MNYFHKKDRFCIQLELPDLSGSELSPWENIDLGGREADEIRILIPADHRLCLGSLAHLIGWALDLIRKGRKLSVITGDPALEIIRGLGLGAVLPVEGGSNHGQS